MSRIFIGSGLWNPQVARLNNVFFNDQSDEFMPESVCELDLDLFPF
jgi:hypothetical protein